MISLHLFQSVHQKKLLLVVVVPGLKCVLVLRLQGFQLIYSLPVERVSKPQSFMVGFLMAQ